MFNKEPKTTIDCIMGELKIRGFKPHSIFRKKKQNLEKAIKEVESAVQEILNKHGMYACSVILRDIKTGNHDGRIVMTDSFRELYESMDNPPLNTLQAAIGFVADVATKEAEKQE